MTALEQRLPSPPFLRIHRSHIVNLDHLATFMRRPDGRIDARMKNGTVVTASRARSQELRGSTY
jgi:two-component system LytT family response regulator